MTTLAAPAPPPLVAPPVARWGAALCLVSAAGFGVAPVFAKESYQAGINVTTMLSVRFAVAAVVFWAAVAWRRPALPTRRVLLACVILGAVGYSLQAAFYFGALTRIDASLAALILYVYPALVTVLAILLRREKPHRRRVAALACSALGLLLLLGTGGTGGSIATGGGVLAISAAAAYALYLTVADGLPTDLDLYLLSAIVCTGAAAALGTAGLLTGSLATPERPCGWLWVGLLAVFSTVLPVATLLAGVRAVGASTAAILSCAEAAVTVSATALVYGERLTAGQALGGVAVLTAVVVLQFRRPGAQAASGAGVGSGARSESGAAGEAGAFGARH